MTRPLLSILSLAATLAIGAAPARAADCATDKARDALTAEEVQALYDCISDRLIEGYAKAKDIPGVPGFREDRLVSTAPFVSATHGSMFVKHWVNTTGAELYTRWEDMDGAKLPVGTILAKESFRLDNEGVAQPGPLFLMEKVAADAAPDGWVYTRLFPNGKYQRTGGPGSDKVAFCHECHAATLDDQDASFFPPDEYRVASDCSAKIGLNRPPAMLAAAASRRPLAPSGSKVSARYYIVKSLK